MEPLRVEFCITFHLGLLMSTVTYPFDHYNFYGERMPPITFSCTVRQAKRTLPTSRVEPYPLSRWSRRGGSDHRESGIQRRRRHLEAFGHVIHRHGRICQQGAGHHEAGAGPLPDDGAFTFRECPQKMKDECPIPPGVRVSIASVRERTPIWRACRTSPALPVG